MKIKSVLMLTLLTLTNLTNANSDTHTEQKLFKYKGYSVYGCESSFRDYDKNLCSKKVMEEVLAKSTSMPINFDKDKKLIQYRHTTNNKTLYEVITVSEKNKTISIRLAPSNSELYAIKIQALVQKVCCNKN